MGTGAALRLGRISEESLQVALRDARGDIFQAAMLLGAQPREVDRYIRLSEPLQAFVATIHQVKSSPEYDRMSAEQYNREIELRQREGKLLALTALSDLAAMTSMKRMTDDGEEIEVPLSAAMAKVKLDAAVALNTKTAEQSADAGNDAVLRQLNELYQSQSARIKEIRQTVITMQAPAEPPALVVTVDLEEGWELI